MRVENISSFGILIRPYGNILIRAVAKSEAKSPRLLRGLQVDFSLTSNVSYAVR